MIKPSNKSAIHCIPLFIALGVHLFAFSSKPAVDNRTFLDGIHFQVGLDMTLQHPYGYDFSDVFPYGQSYGVDLAIGRWFTPQLGLRVKANWENGIALFENRRAEWLAPFHEKGVNMDRGGYLSVFGDVQLNLHSLFLNYDADRFWNFYIYPRAGLVYNFGVEKGSPLIGIGFGNNFRIDERFSLYFDVAYNGVSSGFVGCVKDTGYGTGHNGYFDFNLGVQVELGDRSKVYHYVKESFWDHWFVQAGLDMTLFKPFDRSWSGVFPKGRTFGVDFAAGKWFSPDIAVRGRINWENGIPLFENDRLEWVAPAGSNGINMDKGGCLAVYLDVPLSITNMFMFGLMTEKLNLYVFPRAGLASNLALESCSPMVGVGIGCTYSLTEKLSFYYDMAFQGITSEFFGDVACTGMEVSTKFNGFQDCHIGVQWSF